jgi:hypothetical protein
MRVYGELGAQLPAFTPPMSVCNMHEAGSPLFLKTFFFLPPFLLLAEYLDRLHNVGLPSC